MTPSHDFFAPNPSDKSRSSAAAVSTLPPGISSSRRFTSQQPQSSSSSAPAPTREQYETAAAVVSAANQTSTMPWGLRSRSKSTLRDEARRDGTSDAQSRPPLPQSSAADGHVHASGRRATTKPSLRGMLDTAPVTPPRARQSMGKTFFEDATPGAEAPPMPFGPGAEARLGLKNRPRDSHELDLAHDTRHSVVENMLFSLGQIPGTSPAGYNSRREEATESEDQGASAFSRFGWSPSAGSAGRGHTRSSSFSSAYDAKASGNSPAWGGSGFTAARRRSNSGSDFPSDGSRTGTMRAGASQPIWSGTEDESNADQKRNDARSTARKHGQSRKTSKSSGSSSLDMGSSLPGAGRKSKRSASFDQSYYDKMTIRTDQSPILQQSKFVPPSPHRAGIPNVHTFDSHENETAPSPTIPSGRYRAPQHPHHPPPLPPTTPTAVRGHGMRSAASRAVSRKGTTDFSDSIMRGADNDFPGSLSPQELSFPPNITDEAAAPSPNVSLRKNSAPNPTMPAATKEQRPGFFRRVFGSSNRQAASQDPARANSTPASSSLYTKASSQSNTPLTRQSRSGSVDHGYAAAKTEPIAPTAPPAPASSTPTLSKKPSSFFRRRKKSIAEVVPPPRLPHPLPQALHISLPQSQSQPQPQIQSQSQLQPQPQPEPPSNENEKPPPPPPENTDMSPQTPGSISSLRQLMNPYLRDIGKDNSDTFYDSREQQPHSGSSEQDPGRRVLASGFSFTPFSKRDAAAGSADASDSVPPKTAPSAASKDDATPRATAGTASPRSRLKIKVRRGARTTGQEDAIAAQDDTFLAESSSNDSRKDISPTTQSPPALVARDQQRPRTSPTAPSHSIGAPNADYFTARPNPPQQSNAPTRSPPVLASVSAGGFKSWTPAELDNEGWVITPTGRTDLPTSTNTPPVGRPWLRNAASEETFNATSRQALPAPADRPQITASLSADKQSPITPSSPTPNEAYQSATSLPIVQVEGEEDHSMPQSPPLAIPKEPTRPPPAPLATPTTPTTDDFVQADKIFHGEEDMVTKDKAAAFLGDGSPAGARLRLAYMRMYNWTGINLLAAMRDMCNRLVLKGETQQVDRILDALSDRWCECNPNHGFRSKDVVHTICYSILLLNTDLHMADIDNKMTRSQFVKNTLPTIRRVLLDSTEAGADPDETIRPSTHASRPPIPWTEPNTPRDASPVIPFDTEERRSLDGKKPRNRLARPGNPRNADSESSVNDATSTLNADSCNVLVKAPYDGGLRGWEFQVEIVLKEFYSSIRAQRLPLHGATDPSKLSALPSPSHAPYQSGSNTNLAVAGSAASMAGSFLRRTPSLLSKAPSETASNFSRRSQMHPASDFRNAVSGRWTSRSRSKPKVGYSSTTVGSSRTSLDDGGSVWSPAGSSSWSKHSFGSHYGPTSASSVSMPMGRSNLGPGGSDKGDYQQSIGFANALSKAIIREEHAANNGQSETGDNEDGRVAPVPLLEDESLGLAGPPWAKEGLLKHKHHLESVDKKAKDRNWTDCFAVIEKGWVRLFSFQGSQGSSSLRLKSSSHRARQSGGNSSGVVVGGGNWSENAASLGSFLLRQTIASALPPPGYSKTRPHVWALSLPTGAVHLFQCGSPDVAQEFVVTANYWSARLSKEPLVGGVSNIEYGWGDNLISLGASGSNLSISPQPPSSSQGSMQSLPTDASGLVRNTPPSTAIGYAPSPYRHRGQSNPSVSSLPAGLRRPSIAASVRSSIETNGPPGRTSTSGPSAARNTARLLLPGDRAAIAEWAPPTQSMMASNLMEVDQLRALSDYVKNIEGELAQHNELRGAMVIAFSPRHPNGNRALNNWEKKSAYLLREIVKFRTYIDSLNAAQTAKERLAAEKEKRGSTASQDTATKAVAALAATSDDATASNNTETQKGDEGAGDAKTSTIALDKGAQDVAI